MSTARDRRERKAYTAPRDTRRDEHAADDAADAGVIFSTSFDCDQCGVENDPAFTVNHYSRAGLYLGRYCDPCITTYAVTPYRVAGATHYRLSR